MRSPGEFWCDISAIAAVVEVSAAVVAYAAWQSPKYCREIAAWLLARARFVEHLRAERERWRAECDEYHEAKRAEFGLVDAEAEEVI